MVQVSLSSPSFHAQFASRRFWFKCILTFLAFNWLAPSTVYADGKATLIKTAVESFQLAERDGSISGMLKAAANILTRIPGNSEGAMLYGAALTYIEADSEATAILLHPGIDTNHPIFQSARERLLDRTMTVKLQVKGDAISKAVRDRFVRALQAGITKQEPKVFSGGEDRRMKELMKSIEEFGKVPKSNLIHEEQNSAGIIITLEAVPLSEVFTAAVALKDLFYEDEPLMLERERSGKQWVAQGTTTLRSFAFLQLEGLPAGSTLVINGGNPRKKGTYWAIPSGVQELSFAQKGLNLSWTVTLNPGEKKSMKVPSFIRVSTSVGRYSCFVDGTPVEENIQGETLLVISPNKSTELMITAPKRVSYKKKLTLNSGELQDLSVSEKEFPLDIQWAAYEKAENKRLMSWWLIGGGGTLIATSAIFAALSSGATSDADSAYLRYRRATTYLELTSAKDEAESLDETASNHALTGMATGIIGAGLLTTGIVLLLQSPVASEPETAAFQNKSPFPWPQLVFSPNSSGVSWSSNF